MAFQHTKEQKRAIDIRNTEVIVSAGAGAGKTAVLVERVINLITDENIDFNIDDLLIVTFTNEASNVMKDRIYTALNSKLAEDYNNEKILRQIYALNKANISTIHGFCQKVIEKNSNQLNIDPKFRVASQDEVVLVKSEVFDEVIENFYSESEKGDKTFHKLVNCFISKVNDEPFKKAFMNIFNKAYNNPDPIKWVQNSVESYNFSTVEDIFMSNDFNIFKNNLLKLVRKKQNFENKYRDVFHGVDQKKVEEAYSYFKEDIEYIEFLNTYKVIDKNNFKSFFTDLNNILHFPKIASRSHKMDDELKEYYTAFKAQRDILSKESEKALKDNELYTENTDVLLYVYKNMYEYMKEFLKFFEAFNNAYKERKTLLKFIDFNDMEQLTLEVLFDHENGEMKYSKACEYYQSKFKEVIVDEYQDCNYTQETIFKAITKGGENMFMVGDIKQSIYKFRGAKPDIFKSKLNTENTSREVINLNKNFRSEKNILDFVNKIFSKVMNESSGNINYDESHMLNLGRNSEIDGNVEILLGHGYPLVDANIASQLKSELKEDDVPTEEDIINIIDEKINEGLKSKDKIKDDEKQSIAKNIVTALNKNKGVPIHTLLDNLSSEVDVKTFEAEIIAKKILSLKNKGNYDFKDIVILLRSKSNMKSVSEILEKYDIPSIFDEKENLFTTYEIQSVTSFLKIIDNKLQDIPLVSVLKLPIYDFTEDELLHLKKTYDENSFFKNIVKHFEKNTNYSLDMIISENTNEQLQYEDDFSYKCFKFLNDYYYFKRIYKKMRISDLIIHYMQYTNLSFYLQNHEKGGVKDANIHILIEYAKAFENTSYSSIFHFIKFIEKQEKNEEVEIESASTSDNQNAVRLMTIHASKGLEFNVVFLCNISKQFNKMDLRAKYICENRFSFKYKDYNKNYILETLPFINIKSDIDREILAEELRTLYVALTRPEKELYITYITNDIDKDSQKFEDLYDSFTNSDYDKINSYSDIIMPITMNSQNKYVKHVYSLEDITSTNVLVQDVKEQEEIQYNLKDYFFNYEHHRDEPLPVDISVTKLLALEDLEEKREFREVEKQESQKEYKVLSFKKPSFVESKTIKKGVEFGTLIHKIFWLIPFNKNYELEDIQNLILSYKNKGIIEPCEYDAVIKNINSIYKFFESDIYEKLLQAEKIYKEKPFATLVEGEPYYENAKDDKLLLKGIIDLLYFYNDEIYILDFKTDYNKEVLMEKYKRQIEYYSEVLEKVFNKKVRGKYLYFTTHNEVIEV